MDFLVVFFTFICYNRRKYKTPCAKNNKRYSHEEKNIQVINGKRLLIKTTNYSDVNLVKTIADNLVDLYKDVLVFIINVVDDKIFFVAKTTQNYVSSGVHCGKFVKEAAILCNGNGGGRPDMAQAGGKDISKVNEVIEKVKGLL